MLEKLDIKTPQSDQLRLRLYGTQDHYIVRVSNLCIRGVKYYQEQNIGVTDQHHNNNNGVFMVSKYEDGTL
jgi:hypothetical protein